MNIEPFILTARLQTRLSLKRPVHLDGLLLAAREIERDRIDLEPLDCVVMEDGVYRASAGVMIASGLAGATTSSVGRVSRVRLEGGDIQFIHVYENTPSEGRSIDWKSPFRPMLQSQTVIDGIVAISWALLGDRDAVMSLARRIHCIGSSANTGMGRVLSWEAEDCVAAPEDVGWFGGGAPIRNLPAEVVRKRIGAIHHPGTALLHECCAPPYWDKSRKTLVVSPRLSAMIASSAAARRMLSAA